MSPNPFATPERLRRLQIEVTTACNLSCQGCQRTIGRARGEWKSVHMDPEAFSAILAHAPACDVLVLQGIGEPTLHPRLDELVRRGRAWGKAGDLTLNTNALAQPIEFYARLRQAGLNHISISVDGLEPELAQATRAGTDAAELARRIPQLVELFAGRVTFSVVLSRLNLPHLPALATRLAQLGARLIEVQPLVSYAAGADALSLDGAELARAAETVRAIGAGLPGLTLMMAAAMTPDGSRCRRPFHSAYVTVDGLLTPCCLTNDTTLLGRTSLLAHDFAAAWQAPALAAWYSRYLDREPEICRGCGFNARGPEAVPAGLIEGRHLRRAGRHREAVAALLPEVARPANLAALQELALAVAGRGDKRAAEVLLTAAAAVQSGPQPILGLVGELLRQGDRPLALHLLNLCLDRHPDNAESYRLAVSLYRNDAAGLEGLARRAAMADCREGVALAFAALEPFGAAAPVLTLAHVLRTSGRADLARRLLEPALAKAPGDLAARMAWVVAQTEIVYAGDDHMADRRRALMQALDEAEACAATADAAARQKALEQIGQSKLFYLSYQGQADREVYSRWGDLLSSLTGPAAKPKVAVKKGEKLRVGFVSSYFRPHSVSKLFGGWMRGLDRDRFHVTGYDVRAPVAHSRPALAQACDSYHSGARPITEWMRLIAADRPHVLIYPELGMDPNAVRLAVHRLAPVQCVSWGHPVTTGLPAIDYFLSSALMEPEDGESHYREKLVRLPNLSVDYAPLGLPGGKFGRERLGLAADDVAFICCQSLYKYLPAHDGIFAAIARGVDKARFVFIDNIDRFSAARFRARLGAAFAAVGLDAGRHVRFVPSMPQADFPSFLQAGDVYLDSIGWSGGNTTLEAIEAGLPVVTTPTALMRGRHSAAILTRMGLGELVAPDAEAYVRLAVALGNDPQRRAAARARIEQSRGRLYHDAEAVRALEAFLIKTVKSA